MQYLIAFDKFKGALPAHEACGLAAKAIVEIDSTATIESAPLTDGGEGFASILSNALDGDLIEVEVPGPLFHPVMGKFALVQGRRLSQAARERLKLPEHAANGLIGIVEMASSSGYEALGTEQRNPWQTSTYGTGLLMKAAVEAGARALVVGIGGSATNDCGAGALEALGVLYYDRDLQPVKRVTPENFRRITSAGSTSHLIEAFPPVRIACDVTNPLLGPNGATRVFGPQKGLRPEDTDRMERTLHKMATRLLGVFGRNPADWDTLLQEPGSGAAGGIGFALRHALPDSAFVPGFELVSDWLELSAKVTAADRILTGEGRLDQSSLTGKGPVSLIRMADPSKEVFLFVGSAEVEVVSKLKAMYPKLKVLPVSDPGWPIEKALRETPTSLLNSIQKALS